MDRVSHQRNSDEHTPPLAGFGRLITWLVVSLGLLLQGCPTPYELRHANQWDSGDQIWLSEESQVKIRASQSRVFDTVDQRKMLATIVSTMQDLNFKVEVLDEELGVVSG